jgi:cell division protein ZapA (FtsZ GTPase activity inhibitor)
VTEKRSVPVHILGKEYRLRTDADPATVRQAAELVAQMMERVRGRSGRSDTFDVMLLAALNLANDLIVLREQAAARPADPGRVAELVALLESVVVESASAAH